MKRVNLTTALTAALVLLVFGLFRMSVKNTAPEGELTVGFIYDGDESTPYTYGFASAERALAEQFPGEVNILTMNNVPDSEMEYPVRDMIGQGCRILFTNSYSEQFKALAEENPDVQFCQVSFREMPDEEVPENYHTFKGEIYQARYVSGVAAGLKLKEMMSDAASSPKEPVIGYVAAYPTSEVISGFTAFLLGVRSVVPEAVMRVHYTNSWGNYALEKSCTKKLIDEGCMCISQHTDTIGPAVACEEAASKNDVFFVSYNQSMMGVAPTTALIACRINWTPYIIGAVRAVLDNTPIEKGIDGNRHGHDMSAGFDRDWVETADLNLHIAAADTREKLDETIAGLKKGTIQVFKGNYIGVSPEDESDTVDLRTPYTENRDSSFPTFHYILKDVVTVEDEGE